MLTGDVKLNLSSSQDAALAAHGMPALWPSAAIRFKRLRCCPAACRLQDMVTCVTRTAIDGWSASLPPPICTCLARQHGRRRSQCGSRAVRVRPVPRVTNCSTPPIDHGATQATSAQARTVDVATLHAPSDQVTGRQSASAWPGCACRASQEFQLGRSADEESLTAMREWQAVGWASLLPDRR